MSKQYLTLRQVSISGPSFPQKKKRPQGLVYRQQEEALVQNGYWLRYYRGACTAPQVAGGFGQAACIASLHACHHAMRDDVHAVDAKRSHPHNACDSFKHVPLYSIR